MHVLGKTEAPTGKAARKPGKPKVTTPANQPEAASVEPGNDELDAFAATYESGNAIPPMMLLFWKDRMQNPTFSVEVTKADLDAFGQCMKYLGVEPQIRVFRPQGTPARAAVPATDQRSAIPARPAGPPKDYVVMQMVDAEGNAIVPVESNELDHERMQQAKTRKLMLATAPQLAAALRADLTAGVFSTSTIEEAAKVLVALAQG